MVKMTKFKFAALAGVAVLAIAGAANADTVFNNRAAFLSATSGLTNIDFNGIAGPGSYVSFGNGPLSLSGATFTGNGSMFVIDPGYYGFGYPNGGFLNSDYNSPNEIDVALPASTAVGFDFGGLLGGPVTFTINTSNGGSFTASTNASTAGGGLDFFGVVTSTPITSVSILMPDCCAYNAVDNFAFGAGVPEPATWGMMLLGMAGLGVAMRNRRKLAAVTA
jgi:hypothetical protein